MAENDKGSNQAVMSALQPLLTALHQCGFEYRLTGSVASSLLGLGRTTFDADVVVNLNQSTVLTLANQLQSDYLVDPELMQEALDNQQAFNLIHRESMLKIDVFPIQNREYNRVAFGRSIQIGNLTLLTPEDLILAKLEWFVAGDQTSLRQWQDVLGIVRIQKERLDIGYMRHWANDLGLSALLEKALDEI